MSTSLRMNKSEKIGVRIEIEDTGPGLKKQDIMGDRLFSPFIQTERGLEQGGKGTGLGLALVRQIVKLSGGRLGVKSKVGVGSTFWVELPFAVGEKAIAEDFNNNQKRKLVSQPGITPTKTFPTRPTRFSMVGFGEAHDDDMISETVEILMPVSLEISESSIDSPPLAPPPLVIGSIGIPLSDLAKKGIKRRSGSGGNEISDKSLLNGVDLRKLSAQEGSAIAEDWEDNHSNVALVPPSSDDSSPDHFLFQRSITVADDSPRESRSSSSVKRTGSLDTQTKLTSAMSRRSSGPSSTADSDELKLNALVVDDDQITRKLMEKMLGRLGCVVEQAEHGQAALEKLLGTAAAPGRKSTNGTPPAEERSEPIPPRRFDIIFL
jgi:osomolarity two-component system, sensor histidine kinase SLN1